MSWMEPNIHKGRGSAIGKELAEKLGIFDSATGFRRKQDGSLLVLWPADTPKERRFGTAAYSGRSN